MKILVTGYLGQLGHECMERFAKHWTVSGMDLPQLDIADPTLVREALDAVRPDVVVNCAAFTNVDAAETERERAWAVNVAGPRHLAEWLARHGGRLVHISTDYVFDGRRPAPYLYNENDTPSPLSWYGETKWKGELAIAEVFDRWAVLRTSWLYGAKGRNFLRTILARGLREKRVKLVADQHGSPTWAYRLAEQIAEVIRNDLCGLFHAGGEGSATWYELGARFLRTVAPSVVVEPCSSADFPRPAPRPRNSALANARLKEVGASVMRPWVEDVEEFARYHAKEWLSGGGAPL